MNWSRQLKSVIEDVITDIMFVYPDTSHEVAELTASTMIRYPGLLVELNEQVKDKRELGTRGK
jgi:ATP-dependent protease Clp ATPase subunit